MVWPSSTTCTYLSRNTTVPALSASRTLASESTSVIWTGPVDETRALPSNMAPRSSLRSLTWVRSSDMLMGATTMLCRSMVALLTVPLRVMFHE